MLRCHPAPRKNNSSWIILSFWFIYLGIKMIHVKIKDIVSLCGNKTTQMRTKAIHSELVTAEESATITCMWQRLKSRRESGKAVQWKKGKTSGMLIGGCWQGELEASNLESSRHILLLVREAYLVFCGWFWVGSGGKNKGDWPLRMKWSWPCGMYCCRSCGLAS